MPSEKEKSPPLDDGDPTTDADKNTVLRNAINDAARNDPTRFTTRSFAVLWNEGHSIRLINRVDPRWAVSIPWDELDALRAILGTGDNLLADLRILCQTVRVLRELAYVPKILSDDEEITYRDRAEQLLRYKVDLQSRLAQVGQELANEKRLRCELKQIAKAGIGEVSSVGTVMKENAVTDFRTGVINLCKEKAAEWQVLWDRDASGDHDEKIYMVKAANELIVAIENLDHKGE